MERRKAVRIALVIASISTAFLPWITISFFGFTASVSLMDMLAGSEGFGTYLQWSISGSVYLLGSALLLVRDEAAYLQLFGLVMLPALIIVDSGSMGPVRSITLLWSVTGSGAWLAHATALMGLLLYARPRRVMALLERIFDVVPSHQAIGQTVGWIHPRHEARERHFEVRYGIACDQMSEPRPVVRPRPITGEDWWSDDVDRVIGISIPEKVPCIRLPPPRTRGECPREGAHGQGHHDER